MFCAIILGITAYLLSISKYFIKINVKLIKIFKFILSKVFYICGLPFIYLLKGIKKLLNKPLMLLVINFKKMKKNIKPIKKNKKIFLKRKDFSA